MKSSFDDNLVWQVTQPTDGAPHLFSVANSATYNYGIGGSERHKKFVWTRLFRTFAQFKTDPSNTLVAGIKAAAMAEFNEHQKNRVGAPAISIKFQSTTANNVKMLTFPFRVLCHQTGHVERPSPLLPI